MMRPSPEDADEELPLAEQAQQAAKNGSAISRRARINTP
jgi:hypothetical protein